MSSPSATSSNAFTWVNESFPPEKCRKKENHDHETWLVKCFLQSHIIISITNPHRLPGHLRRAPFLTACTSSPPPPPCQQGRPWGGQSSPFVTLLSFSFCFIFLHTVFQLLIFWDNLGMVQEDLAISPGGLYESYFLYIILLVVNIVKLRKKLHIISTMRLRVRKMALWVFLFTLFR